MCDECLAEENIFIAIGPRYTHEHEELTLSEPDALGTSNVQRRRLITDPRQVSFYEMKFSSSIRGGVFFYSQMGFEILECLGGMSLRVPLCDRYSYRDVTQLPLLNNNGLASLDWFDRMIGPARHFLTYFSFASSPIFASCSETVCAWSVPHDHKRTRPTTIVFITHLTDINVYCCFTTSK